ncbi:transcription termination/antitermination NusG family protein [Rhodoferax sp.]|uniref:transcription termination/antitermination protein NusG n=1 Tax=Rhodoferax sp. TaxID=50421 RepID=UPI002625D881|nr:transcription termination/antitermination NusG family protein [Rhodoferax sp.]MDD2919620.1 transcription termination/antitermination NusG family protein [Rhodoferax sp.]
MSHIWYLVYTKPKQESIALLNLQQQGFHAYLPLYKNFKNSPGTSYLGFEVMFPRYVFFRPASAAQSIASVRSTRGVMSLVRFGHEPALVKNVTVRAIQQFEQQRNNAELADISPLQPGTAVRFKHSALKGIQGLVKSVSSKRVAVLLELLGQDQLVHVDHGQIELI